MNPTGRQLIIRVDEKVVKRSWVTFNRTDEDIIRWAEKKFHHLIQSKNYKIEIKPS